MNANEAIAVIVHRPFTPHEHGQLPKGRYRIAQPDNNAATDPGRVFFLGWDGCLASIAADDPWITLLDRDDTEIVQGNA